MNAWQPSPRHGFRVSRLRPPVAAVAAGFAGRPNPIRSGYAVRPGFVPAAPRGPFSRRPILRPTSSMPEAARGNSAKPSSAGRLRPCRPVGVVAAASLPVAQLPASYRFRAGDADLRTDPVDDRHLQQRDSIRIVKPTCRDSSHPDGALHQIGETGFEPATARPPAECATRLRHSPWLQPILTDSGKLSRRRGSQAGGDSRHAAVAQW